MRSAVLCYLKEYSRTRQLHTAPDTNSSVVDWDIFDGNEWTFKIFGKKDLMHLILKRFSGISS